MSVKIKVSYFLNLAKIASKMSFPFNFAKFNVSKAFFHEIAIKHESELKTQLVLLDISTTGNCNYRRNQSIFYKGF